MKTQAKSARVSVVKKALLSALAGLAATMALLLGVSMLLSAGAGSMELSGEYVIVATIFGAALAGFVCAAGEKSGVLLRGLMAAVAFVVLLLLCSTFVPAGEGEGSILLKNILAAVAGGAFGGTLRLYRKTKKAKIRRR